MYFNQYWIGNPKPDIKIELNNIELKVADNYKYLGIILDDKLNFIANANKTIKDTWHKLAIFGRLRYCIPDEVALQFYKTMILPILEFGNIFNEFCPSNIRNKLQRLQNKGLKIAPKRIPRYPTFNLHIGSNLSSFSKRAEIAQMILLYRYIMKESKDHKSDVRGISWGKSNIMITNTEIENVVNIGLLYHRLNGNNLNNPIVPNLNNLTRTTDHNTTTESDWSQGDLSDSVVVL